MAEIFELIMIICFGISWPISVYKSLRSKSTKGKSPVFMAAIVLGYVAGIIGKIIKGNINYVFVIYCVNLAVVCFDFILFAINKRNEKRAEITEAVPVEGQNRVYAA